MNKSVQNIFHFSLSETEVHLGAYIQLENQVEGGPTSF
jgi:hypothetical protein